MSVGPLSSSSKPVAAFERAVVLADTHIGASGRQRLPGAVYGYLEQADVILHAGDILVAETLAELERFAPVHAVLGNNDHTLVDVLPETTEVDIGGVAVAMVHDSGPTAGRARRLRRRFPTSDVVVFGHSHQPVDAPGLDGQRLFNPGSPTQRRRAPTPTLGILEAEQGRLVRHEIVDL